MDTASLAVASLVSSHLRSHPDTSDATTTSTTNIPDPAAIHRQTITIATHKRNSCCGGGSASAVSSHGGGVADNDSDSASTENASMRPLAEPRRKKRRTILDAFNSIHLTTHYSGSLPHSKNAPLSTTAACSHHPSDAPLDRFTLPQSSSTQWGSSAAEDADSSQAVADDTNDVGGYSTASSLADDEESQDTMNLSAQQPPLHEVLLSDKDQVKQAVERKVMYELVFGPDSTFVPRKDPVDRKLDQLILRTSLQHQKQSSQSQTTATVMHSGTGGTLDDMSLSTNYNSGTTFDRANLWEATTAHESEGSMAGSGHAMLRSNSLPELYARMESVEEDMDVDDG